MFSNCEMKLRKEIENLRNEIEHCVCNLAENKLRKEIEKSLRKEIAHLIEKGN